jgi:ABC-2 type transport system permease protein
VRRAYRAEALKASRQPTLLIYALIVVTATFLAGWIEAAQAPDAPEAALDNGVASEDADLFESPVTDAADTQGPELRGPNAFPVFGAAARTGFLVASLLILLYSANLLAGEGTGGTFRLLLVRPVTKTDVILAKWLLVVAAVLTLTLLISVVAWLAGHLFGTYAEVSPYSAAELAERALVCVGVTPLGMLAFAGVGLFLSALFQSSVGAVTAATLVGIGVFALNLFLTEEQQLLNLAAYSYRFLDMFESWAGGESSYAFGLRQVRPAFVVPAAYALVFLGAARIMFGRRDIHS